MRLSAVDIPSVVAQMRWKIPRECSCDPELVIDTYDQAGQPFFQCSRVRHDDKCALGPRVTRLLAGKHPTWNDELPQVRVV